MPLAPRFIASHTLKPVCASTANIVDLYLDYCCPFCKKLFFNWYEKLIPQIDSEFGPETFQFRFLHVPQTWHPTSTLMHEVALAVARLAPEEFFSFSYALFEQQSRWFDEPTYEKSRSQIYRELADFAEETSGVPASRILELVAIDPSSGEAKNLGNAVGKDLKYFTRLHRQNGVHMTPSIAINGILQPSIESSTPAEDVLRILRSHL